MSFADKLKELLNKNGLKAAEIHLLRINFIKFFFTSVIH